MEDVDISWVILALVVSFWALKEIGSVFWSKSRHAANQATIQLTDATIQSLQIEIERLQRGNTQSTLDQLVELVEQRNQEIEQIIPANQKKEEETALRQALRESWRFAIPPYGTVWVRMIQTERSLSFR